MAAAAMIVGVLLPSSAIGGVPPPDVQQVFDEVALPFIHESADGLGVPSVYEDTDGISNVTELFVFTPAYLRGSTVGPAYRPTGEWIATLTADFVAVGTVRVRTADGVEPFVSAWNGDAELAGKLENAAGVDLVEDEATGSYYAVFGETIGPLNDAAVAQLPTPTALAEFQEVLVARLANGDGAEAAGPPEPGSILGFIGVGVAVVAGAAVLISARVRARRSATG